MESENFENLKVKCERCEHRWHKRQGGDPVACPRCKSPLWNKPRKQKIEAKG